MFIYSQRFNLLMAMHRSSTFIQTTTATLLLLASGCTSNQPPQNKSSSPTPSVAAVVSTPKVVATKTASPSFQSDAIERAEDKAIAAQNLAKSAKSTDDWNLVASRWQQAIALWQTVPNSHPKKAIAQQKIAASQRQLAAAKQQITNLTKPPIAASTTVQTQPIATVNYNPGSPKFALAQHLKKIGAKMYSTYWCSSCRWQERQFGEAQNLLKSIEIECDPRGENAKPQLCYQAQVRAYPTWEINGQLYGPMRLEQLAEISGYKGPSNFDS